MSTKEKYFQGLGRRKRAIAQVRIFSGSGECVINGEKENILDAVCQAPLKILGLQKKVRLEIKVSGGGFSSQKDAIQLAIARALIKKDEKNKSTMRKAGFLTRDPREKERKKPGLKRARRAPQWAKR
ncbi:MAG: SSU ribosomal protein S9P [Candidatus Berkelbacteria bacterium Licking1014_7]|uniref:30S ribosomal protein S9 n=1 Tax=Candidatus Berkelbacteria bacterium Licking1014_7 TaxID=2017147 RepID=A0A554LI37_9BACT|nr:MAG: SSU ribosomal protein S9P [Candidatus Berkelbacteria bacterium Licking1014_7]